MKTVLVFLLGFSLQVLADHHEHGGLKHGHATLNIAFLGHEGKLVIAGPSETILGIDHYAEKKADSEAVEAGFKKLQSNIENIVFFDPKYGCLITKDVFSQTKSGENKKHADASANFNVKCERSLEDSTITITVQKYLPKVKETVVEVAVNAIQASVVVKNKSEKIVLK